MQCEMQSVSSTKAMVHEGDDHINCDGCSWNGLQRPLKETGKTVDRRKNRNHTYDSAVEIS